MLPEPGTDQTLRRKYPQGFMSGTTGQIQKIVPANGWALCSLPALQIPHSDHRATLAASVTMRQGPVFAVTPYQRPPGQGVFEELDMLRTSREHQHTVCGEMRRSAGLLHLVCIPQPSTGGKWLVENSTFAPFTSDEGQDKERVPSNSVELALKKITLCYFQLKVIGGMWWINKGKRKLQEWLIKLSLFYIHNKCFCRLL